MRLPRSIALIIVALCVFASCRTTRPEAGLPPSAFQGLFPRVVSNDRGFWFLVSDTKTEREPFVAIENQGVIEVFYAIPVGQRTSRLLPVTPFAYGLLDSTRDLGRVEARWLSTPAAAGPDLPDTVGWMADSKTPPTWAGPVPIDGTPVMLVSGAPPEAPRLADWFVGTGFVQAGKLTGLQFFGTPSGPLVVLPDGTRATRPIRSALAGLSIKPVDGVEFSSMSVELADGPASVFTSRPAALRSGADALVSARGEETADITLTRPILRRGLALSVTENPLTVLRTEVSVGLLALRDIAAGRDLAATQTLLTMESPESESGFVARMRALELLAAAGFVDWSRHEMMIGVRGLGAEAALYLSRSHFVGGDLERARDFAARAQERFADWPAPAGALGTGQAILMNARIAAANGDWESAFALAIDAGKQLAAGGDAMRAADTELLAASYATNAQDLSRAVKAAALARSRFFHGKSTYHAAFAELALADIYARAGETDEASKMTDYAVLRFEKLGDAVGRNRARIAEGRVASARSRAQAVRDLEIGLEKAQTAGDFVGVVDAAASLVILNGAPKDATATYGLVIAAGMARTVDPYVRERAAQALSLLCGRGMADSVGRVQGASPRDIAVAKSACAAPAAVVGTSGAMVGALVAQGWAAWRLGNVEEATAVVGKLEQLLDDELRRSAPRQAADALFLSAVVARDTEESRSDELTLAAVRLLGDYVDPVNLATTFRELATQYNGRGQVWLGAELLQAAMTAASEQNQTELRRELAMQRVEMLHVGGDYDGTVTATYDTGPILETAGVGSAPLLARLWIIQGDALSRLGRGADAAIAQTKFQDVLTQLDGLVQVRLTSLSGQLAARRGDVATAKAAQTRAERLEAALAEGLASTEARQLLRAQNKVAQAEIDRAEGANGAAANAYAEALDAIADLGTTREVLAMRVTAQHGLGMTTVNDDRLEDAIRALEVLRSSLATDHPEIAPAATAALASLQISAGRPSRALEVVASAGLDGAAAADNPQDALCIEARAAGLSARDGAERMLTRCADATSGDARADAALLAALVNPQFSAADKNRVARELLAADLRLSSSQRARLEFVSELAAGTVKRQDDKEQALMVKLDQAAAGTRPAAVTVAVEAVVGYMLATGQASRAQPIIDRHSGSFYDLGPQGPGALARVRAEAAVGVLDPVASAAFAARALAETPDLDSADEAALMLAHAQNAVLLGMWQAARSDLGKAKAAVRTGTLRRRIEAFARRFSIP